MKKALNTCLILAIFLLIACSNVMAEEIPEGYRGIIETYRDSLRNGTYNVDEYGDFLEGGLVASGEEAMNRYGYGFLDVNGDGIQELFIGRAGESVDLAAIYTLENGQPKQLIKSVGSEDSIALMGNWPDNPSVSDKISHNYLALNGNDFIGINSFYSIEGSNLKFSVSYAENYGTDKYYLSKDENNLYQTQISNIPEFIYTLKRAIPKTPFANYSTLPTEGPEGSIYRVNNPGTGEHLYTLWFIEATELCKNGWMNEGIAWTSPATSDTPIYRLYSAALEDHLYTADPHEVQVLTTEQNWAPDNNGQPVFYSGGDVPIYRLYNPSNYRHLLTKDLNEYNSLPQAGWVQEGIALYALN